MRKIKYILLCLLLILSISLITGCSDSNNNNNNNEDNENTVNDEFPDLVDNESSDTNPVTIQSNFTFNDFSSKVTDAYYKLDDALQEQHPDEYFDYLTIQIFVSKSFLDVAKIETDYMTASTLNNSTWSNVEYPWPSGEAVSVSSFSQSGDIYSYETVASYVDNDTTSSESVTYDSNRAYYSKTGTMNDANDLKDGITYVEYCSDGNDGFYVQFLEILLNDNTETMSVYYFNDTQFNILYAQTNTASPNTTFVKSFKDGMPNSLEELMVNFSQYESIHYDGNTVEIDIQPTF